MGGVVLGDSNDPPVYFQLVLFLPLGEEHLYLFSGTLVALQGRLLDAFMKRDEQRGARSCTHAFIDFFNMRDNEDLVPLPRVQVNRLCTLTAAISRPLAGSQMAGGTVRSLSRIRRHGFPLLRTAAGGGFPVESFGH